MLSFFERFIEQRVDAIMAGYEQKPEVYSGSSNLNVDLPTYFNDGVGCIVLPPGNYEATDIEVPTNTVVVGCGPATKINTTGYAFVANVTSRITFSGMMFQQEGAYVSGIGGGLKLLGNPRGAGLECSDIDIESCVFYNLGLNAIYGENLLEADISRNRFFLCNKDIELKGKTVNINICQNNGRGRGYVGENAGLFLDIYPVFRSTGVRVNDLSLDNAYSSALIYYPEGINVVDNIISGYKNAGVLDGILRLRLAGNTLDSIYENVVKVRGNYYSTITENWFGQIDTYVGAGDDVELLSIENSVNSRASENDGWYLNKGIVMRSCGGYKLHSDNMIDYKTDSPISDGGSYVEI